MPRIDGGREPFAGCSEEPTLGPTSQFCAYTIEGAAVTFRVLTDDPGGWFVESVHWGAD
ncbi:MAG TPA: hypothetical protein VLR26_18175 [Frankiaceae bacterium]|nr:hypothetical protein [Frankiaceae bacterium]